MHCESPLKRLTALLHSTVNTQSQPKLDLLGKFWRAFNTFAPRGKPSLHELCRHLEKQLGCSAAEDVRPWERLFNAICSQPGWGGKTAALFVKNVINVHRGPKELHFLSDSDADEALDEADTVYLPVDAVIIHIFERLGSGRATFKSVNKALMREYDAEEMLIWDDLWYWGFFSQISAKDGETRARRLAWNPDKFWCQDATPKGKAVEVERLTKKFIALC